MTKHADYRAIPATGVFGALTPGGGTMMFYIDRLEPKLTRLANSRWVVSTENCK